MRMDSVRWMILAKNVKELNLSVMSKRMMIWRVPVWIEQLMCFVFKSATVFNGFDGTAEFVEESL